MLALAGSALGPETVDHVGCQPDVALAVLVDLVLVAHAAQRQGRGDERLGRLARRIIGSLRVRRPFDDAHDKLKLARQMLPLMRPPSAHARPANQPNIVQPNTRLNTKIAPSNRHSRRKAMIDGRK